MLLNYENTTTVSDIPKKRIHEEKKVQLNRVMQIETIRETLLFHYRG